jgi:hypothetical protein
VSGTHTFAEREPKRTFIWILTNRDGSLHKSRMTLEDYRELSRLCGPARPLAGRWAYELEGEAGVYPHITEWNAIHGGDGCATPCAKCEAHGYDGRTGKTRASR